jgi:hypothetical protein
MTLRNIRDYVTSHKNRTISNTADRTWYHTTVNPAVCLNFPIQFPDTQSQSSLWPDSLAQELEFLTTVFKDNGYSPQQIRRAMELATRTAKTNDKPTSTAYILYTQTTYGRLSRMLTKHNIKSVVLPPRKLFSYVPPVKDAMGLITPGIYSIPCECRRVYIGQSGWSIQIRIKEHNRHIRLAQPNKSAVAEHSINHDHIIQHKTALC